MTNIDLQWRELSDKSINVVPDDSDRNYELLSDFLHEKKSPIGCHIGLGNDEMRKWVCKMYLGGKQRILGYGSCYQCARLYNAALWRFAKYRIRRTADEKDDNGKYILNIHRFNFDDGEQQAGDDNTQHAEMNALLCSMEELLLTSGLLVTPDERTVRTKQRKSERHHARDTIKGRTEELLEKIFCMVEPSALSIDAIAQQLVKIETRLATIELATRRTDATPIHVAERRPSAPFADEIEGARLKLSAGQNQVVESLKHFFANNGDVQPWTGTTTELGRLVKSTIFRYNSNRLASELIQLQDKHCVDGMWIFFAHVEPCKVSDAVQ